ncbi:uncharacterized protein E6C27_scaffold40G001280 [Cucumis melo var. makuwa]|uniref:Uncharacterized protein n=1 Tax=Cucumis melo var. makuwa TaxID=1194695 RepID=A0A5A7VQM4_CUCMM|nr:uncharacterized protein E6C27_scaffold40G001280 [Cucumis melo var. makuwa]
MRVSTTAHYSGRNLAICNIVQLVVSLDTSLVVENYNFQVYGDLSGWSTKRYQASSICMGDKSSFRINEKISFMGHQRYLLENHVWHRSKLHDG